MIEITIITLLLGINMVILHSLNIYQKETDERITNAERNVRTLDQVILQNYKKINDLRKDKEA